MIDDGKDESAVGPTIIKTDAGAKDGQTKCPKCGATEISLNPNNGMLRCNFCRHEFMAQVAVGINDDIHNLSGEVIGSGATDIAADVNQVLTFKCSSCGAEVVIDTAEVTQARCHWCRNTLSVNQQIPNGSIPDMVLPFKITKDVAKTEIEKFVGKRKFFANPKFKDEFTTQNVMGVYLPYMVIDVNAHANLTGQGEHLVKTYTRGSGNDQKTFYDADLYDVEREFDILVNDLTVESSADKLQHDKKDKTNNIINAIMPFDTENCAKWDANYLRGYTSEKRDTNVEQLKDMVNIQTKDVARHKANEVLKEYDRGVCWTNETLDVKGQKWNSTYLPIWLYSYQQVSGNKKLLHYVAVNARTKETMGSVPIHMPKLLAISTIVEIISVFFWWYMLIDWDYAWLLIFSGFVFFTVFFRKYRNSGARHKHETETQSTMENLRKHDNLIQRRTGLSNSRMQGANNLNTSNTKIGNKLFDTIVGQTELGGIINKISNTTDDK